VSWQTIKLGELARVRTGKLDANAADENGLYPFFTCAKEMTYSNNYSFDDEAILISGNGAGVGYCHYYTGKFEAYQRTYVLRGFKKIEVKFLLHYLLFDLKQKILLGKQDAAMPYIKIGFLEKFLIPLPPLPEQRTIAQVLSKADAAIHTTEKLIAQKELRKKWLMQQLLTGKKRLKGFDGEWKKERLENYLVKHDEKSTVNNQYPVLTSSRRGIFLQSDYYTRDVASENNTGYNVVPRGYFTYRHMSDDLIFKFNINDIVDRGIVSTLYPVFTTKDINSYFLLVKLNEGSEFKMHAEE
jgi:type I restriction enzyme S subunit